MKVGSPRRHLAETALRCWITHSTYFFFGVPKMDDDMILMLAEKLQRIERELSAIVVQLLASSGMEGALKKLLESAEREAKKKREKKGMKP